MNAAARLVHQGVISRRLALTFLLTRRQVTNLLLALLVLCSALSIVYITHTSRILHATYQQNVAQQNRLHVERSQLLLERSTLMMQSRIQHAAETKLGMVIPDHKSVVVIRE